MVFPKAYKVLRQNSFSNNEFSIVPIRYEDRFEIMDWRNEQMYHLRQSVHLTKVSQENYFNNVVASLFDQEKPNQILFSYLKNDKCIGYGGLVHINWTDRNAEISFIMNTEIEKNGFKKHWETFLGLLERVAFKELNLHKIFTYAFDLRPHLYEAVESKGFIQEAILKDHCFFEGAFKDVVIHSKVQTSVNIRYIEESDKQITFEWANDPITRQNSFNSEPILYSQHSKWFDSKLKDKTASYFIVEVDSKPAGLIRFDFDIDENEYIIGITIDANFRGRKLAARFLRKGCDTFFKKRKHHQIVAYIKADNSASIKSFEKVGFKFESKTKIHADESFKYIYDEQ